MDSAKQKTNPNLEIIDGADSFSSLRMTRQLYDCDKENILFTLKDNEGNTFVKAAHEILLNNHMIEALSSKDILLIAYTAGVEHASFNSIELKFVKFSQKAP